MFIEVTNKFKDRKELIHLQHIIRVRPLSPEDGYGKPQIGTEIHIHDGDDGGAYVNVYETYEEVKALIARLDDIAMFRSKEDEENGK